MSFIIDSTSDPEFIIVHRVPILDEHQLHVKADPVENKPARIIDIDERLLTRLAANNNRNIHETGDWVPLTEGHTTDDAPEHSQPEILGYADQFHVGPLFETGRKALLARFRISKDPEKLKKAKNLPRRSVELWLDREEVNPISLLGATAPERNLGLLRLQRMFQVGQLLTNRNSFRDQSGKLVFKQSRHPLKFSYGENPMQPAQTNPGTGCTPTDPGATAPAQVDPALVQAVVSALQQTDVWQQMQQFMMQMQQQPPGMGQPGMGQQQPGAGGEMGGEDPMAQLMAQLQGGQQGMPQMGRQEPKKGKEDEKREGDQLKLQATPGMMGLPGGGGGYLPNMLQMPMTSDRTTNPPRSQHMNHTSHMMAGETLELAVIRLARERDDALRVSREARVTNELLALQTNEGLMLDVAEELPELVNLDDSQRLQRYARMRVRYQKRGQSASQPLNQPQMPTLTPAPGVRTPTMGDQVIPQPQADDTPMTREERDVVIDLIEQDRAMAVQQGRGAQYTPPDARQVLKLLRQNGGLQRMGNRNGQAERVY